MAAVAERHSEAASSIKYLDAASSLWWIAACHVAVGGMAAHSNVDAEVVYGHDGRGGAPGLGGSSEAVFEAIGQHGNKELCARPHAGRQS